MTTVRRRRNDQEATESRANPSDQSTHSVSSLSYSQPSKTDDTSETSPAAARVVCSFNASYHVAKWAILRLLGVVYWFAFLGAYYQNDGLIGQFGLQPTSMAPLERRFVSSWKGFVQHPAVDLPPKTHSRIRIQSISVHSLPPLD